MAENSKIEWTDHTFNPWLGCTKIGPACDHCYAESWAKRTGGAALWQGERRRTSASNWRQPLKWNRQAAERGVRYRVFCASLADVFDNVVPYQWRADLFALIDETPHLDWLLLTKRIGNAVDFGMPPAPRPNVWLGATIANQQEADRDIPKLLATPAAVRFLSIEPMLGPISLSRSWCDYLVGWVTESERDRRGDEVPAQVQTNRIDWVIAGGESGPRARPANPEWFRTIRDQCAGAGVPFLFKQWGEWAPESAIPADIPIALSDRPYGEFHRDDGEWIESCMCAKGSGETIYRAGKKLAGRLLDGRQHDGFPEMHQPGAHR